MRYEVRKIAEIITSQIQLPNPVYEFGAYILEGYEQYNYQDCFRNYDYVSCDHRAGPGVQKVLDVEEVDLANGSVGTVIMFDMIHHVKNFYKAISEIHRILKDDGLLILTTTMHFKILDETDYYRFSPNGIKLLLEEFGHRMIGCRGNIDMPEMIFAMAYKTGKKTEQQLNNFQIVADCFSKFIQDPVDGFSKVSSYKLGVFFHYLTNQLKGQDVFKMEIM